MINYKLHYNALIAKYLLKWENVDAVQCEGEIVDFRGIDPSNPNFLQIIPDFDLNEEWSNQVYLRLLNEGCTIIIFADQHGKHSVTIEYNGYSFNHESDKKSTAIALCAIDFINWTAAEIIAA